MYIETVVNLMIKHMVAQSGMSEDEALEKIYISRTYKLIENEKNGFWSESPYYLAELVLQEARGDRINPQI